MKLKRHSRNIGKILSAVYCVGLCALLPLDIAAAKMPEVVKLNPDGQSYIDHEILQDEGLMVYQSMGQVWIGRLDPATGLFRSAGGKDMLVDSNVTPMQVARNGPEFGIDSRGWSVFYNKDVDGHTQVWRATPSGDGFKTEAVTSGNIDRINQLPSQDPAASSVYLLYGRGDASVFRRGGRRQSRFGRDSSTEGASERPAIVWDDASAPQSEHVVTPITVQTAGFRWIHGTTQFLSTEAEGDHYGQISLTDVRTGQKKFITNDEGIKFDPYGWIAPDYGNAVLVLAAVGHSDIAVYRDTGKQYWERIALLSIPKGTDLRYIQSSEPFTAGGKSYIISTIKDRPGPVMRVVTDSQIWIYDLNSNPDTRFTLRCDDGQPGKIRHEGEVYLGEKEVFVYYNEINKGRSIDVVLCRSGIPVK